MSVETKGPGTVQLLDANDRLHVAELGNERRTRFYSAKRGFAFAHWGYTSTTTEGECARMLEGREFEQAVMQGYQVGEGSSLGRFGVGNGVVQWAFEFVPLLSWGKRGQGVCTATWLSRLPIFEPGYQVIMAHGVVVGEGGYLKVGDERVEVAGGRIYCEKNWGRAFPRRWWWMQSNLWEGVEDLTVTALGAVRGVLWWEEEVGIVAVHFGGEFYEFGNCKLCKYVGSEDA